MDFSRNIVFGLMKKTVIELNNQKFIFVGLCFILLLTGIIYRTSLKGEFLAYDDTENVVNNPLIRNLSLTTLPQFFKTEKLYMYTPVTFLSYAVDYKIEGMDPYWFRLTNLMLHLLNVLLVYILAMQFLRKRILALLVALIFALHPMNVDSVAWISARSNLLAGTFILLSLIFYFFYLKRSKYGYLLLSILAYLLSLLSKSSGALLPLLFFFFDYMVSRKWSWQTILEKVPFFAFGIISGILTLFFRADIGSTQSITSYTLVDRIFMIFFSLDGYLIRTIFPIHLSEIYAYPMKTANALPLLYYLSPIVFLSIPIIIFFLIKSKDIRTTIIISLVIFLLLILPSQVVLLEDGFMANRYGYIPLTGIFIFIAVIIDRIVIRFHIQKLWVISLFIVTVSIFSIYSYHQSQNWKSTFALFDHTISQSPDAAFAYNCRGLAKYSNNDPGGAISDYSSAIRINPGYAGCFYNRGLVFYNNRQIEKALEDYSNAIRLNPEFFSCYTARGILYMDVLNNDSLALADYNEAIRINPEFPQAYYNRGILLMREKNTEDACRDFIKVKELGYSQADELIDRYCR